MNSDDTRSGDVDGNIDGIYNYCDRWCERCALTHRCANFALGREIEAQVEQQLEQERLRNETLWRDLESILGHTLEVIDEHVGRTATDAPPPTSHDLPGWRRLRERRSQTPIAAASFRYGEEAYRLLTELEPVFARWQAEANAQISAGDDAAPLVATAARINEAIEVIGWHMFQIHVKLMRALPHLFDELSPEELIAPLEEEGIELDLEELEKQWEENGEEEEEWIDDPIQNDSNGSAKVALIGIDRSIASWGILWETFGATSEGILPLLVELAQLRRDVESEFPTARAFVRPGFDS